MLSEKGIKFQNINAYATLASSTLGYCRPFGIHLRLDLSVGWRMFTRRGLLYILPMERRCETFHAAEDIFAQAQKKIVTRQKMYTVHKVGVNGFNMLMQKSQNCPPEQRNKAKHPK